MRKHRLLSLLAVGAIAAFGLIVPNTAANAAAPLQITTTSVPSIVQGTYPSTTLKATGGTPILGTYKWSIVGGVLPAGITLSSGGKLSGATGSVHVTHPVNFTAQVKDSKGVTATRNFSFTVTQFKIITTSLMNAKKGQYYSTALKIDGSCVKSSPLSTNPLLWHVVDNSTFPGALPAGLKLSTSGTIYGIAKTVGTYNFYVGAACKVTNAGGDSRWVTLTVV